MAVKYCDHGLATGANDGSSWEDAYQSAYSAINGLASGNDLYIKEHAGIDCTSWAASSTAALSISSKTIKVLAGFDSSLTGTDGVPVTNQTGITVFDAGTNTRRGIYAPSATVEMSYLEWTGWHITSSPINGACIYMDTSGAWDIHDCIFYDCSCSTGSGAGFYVNSSVTATVTDCVFDTCAAAISGGGIYTVLDCTLSGVDFDTCTCAEGGGAIWGGTSDVVATSCTFTDCSSSNYAGGAIWINSDTNASLTLDDCTFTGCWSNNSGGAIYSNSDITATATDFVGCDGLGAYGGAIRADRYCDLDIDDCTFTDCNSVSGGGAIYTECDGARTFAIDACDFTDCDVSAGPGGAIYIYEGTLDTATFTMADSTITTCTASTTGGGVSILNAVTTTVFNTVTIDTCTAGTHGGGIYYSGAGYGVEVIDCDVHGCAATAGNGGGIYWSGGLDAELTRCRVYNNTAGVDGGGVYITGASACDLLAINCVVTGNTSVSEGGGIFADQGGDIVNCTIADNESTGTNYGGIYFTYGTAPMRVDNSIVYGNLGSAVNVQIFADNATTGGAVDYSCVQDKDSTGVEGFTPGANCVDVNPMFLGSGANPYQLMGITACVDGASAAVADYPSTDILGTARVGAPDMGAYELTEVLVPPEYTENNFQQTWKLEDYTRMFYDLLPNGVAWFGRKLVLGDIVQDVLSGSWQDTYTSLAEIVDQIVSAADGDLLARLLSCFAERYVELEGVAWRFINSTDPGVATDLLDEWERVLGLPEDCFNTYTFATIERQRMAHAKLFGTGETTTAQWYVDYSASLGYDVTVVEIPVASAARVIGRARMGSAQPRLGGRGGYSILQITINSGPGANAILKCALNKVKQAHVVIDWNGT